MRGVALDRRRFHRPGALAASIASVDGAPVGVVTENGVDPAGEPVFRLTMGNPSSWNWGAHLGFIFGRNLPAGTRLRYAWWVRASPVMTRDPRIALGTGLESTAFTSQRFTDTWTRFYGESVLAAATVADHRIRFEVQRVAGQWVECSRPVIEIVGP